MLLFVNVIINTNTASAKKLRAYISTIWRIFQMITKLICTITYIVFSLLIFMASNFWILKEVVGYAGVFILFFLIINCFPLLSLPATKHLRTCAKGNALLIEFLGSSALSIILFILGFTNQLPIDNIFAAPKLWIINTILSIILEAIVFWNGMLRIFFSSKQLGIKISIVALFLGDGRRLSTDRKHR